MTHTSESVGILLTNGYISRQKLAITRTELQAQGALVKDEDCQENEFSPINYIGLGRVVAAFIALREEIVDRVVVLGGAPDDRGVPLEQGHAERLRFYAGERLKDRVEVLPRSISTFETKTDLEIVLNQLKERGLDKNVCIISDRAHLFPRTFLIKYLLGYSHARLLSTEKLHRIATEKAKEKFGIELPVVTEYGGVKTFFTYELPATVIQSLDLIPGGRNFGTRFIQNKAQEARSLNFH